MSTETMPVQLITSDFRLLVDENPLAVAPDTAKQIEGVWQKAASQNSNLFDGTILCVTDPQSLTCRPAPYSYFFVQRQVPLLKSTLNIIAISVSGICVGERGVLLAKRSDTVTQYPGMWELAPSGSLSMSHIHNGEADYTAQLLEELYEETGIEAGSIELVEPLALILDAPESTLDICCKIVLRPGVDLPDHAGEYSAFKWINLKDTATFCENQRGSIIPTSSQLLRLFSMDLGSNQETA